MELILFCKADGRIKISKEDFDAQMALQQCKCPICGKIPYRIMKNQEDNENILKLKKKLAANFFVIDI